MSRTNRQPARIRVVGQRRKEPDVRLIARAIIRLSMDSAEATDLLGDLAHEEKAIARRRRTIDTTDTDEAAS